MWDGRERTSPLLLAQEAELAKDAALGVHIRLRLGGVQFPPNIYYKIFTTRPVADLGAFAPRDYALQRKVERCATGAPAGLHMRRAVLPLGHTQLR